MAGSVEIEYDDALNNACWVLVEELQKHGKVSGKQFNNIKGCLKLTIEKYLTERCDNGKG